MAGKYCPHASGRGLAGILMGRPALVIIPMCMLVYIISNEATERSYVGATALSLEARVKQHWKCAKAGWKAPLYVAMREWPKEFWISAVLQNCYNVHELDVLERMWMDALWTRDPAVGYNAQDGNYVASHNSDHKPKSDVRASMRMFNKPFNELTPEERKQFFKECGRKGAIRSRAISD